MANSVSIPAFQPRNRFSLVPLSLVGLGLVLVGCSPRSEVPREVAPTADTVTPASGEVDGGRLAGYTARYRLLAVRETEEREVGWQDDEVTILRTGSGLVVQRVQSVSTARGVLTDSALVRLPDLTPIWHRSYQVERTLLLDFDGPDVSGSDTRSDVEPSSFRRSFALPMFDSGTYDLVIRTLPLAPGYESRVAMYDHDSGGLVVYDVHVLEGRASDHFWTVEVSMPQGQVTLQIDREDLTVLEARFPIGPDAFVRQVLVSPPTPWVGHGGQAGVGELSASTKHIDIRLGDSPRVDGEAEPGEWEDSGALSITIRPDWRVTVRYKHDGESLLFAFVGLTKGSEAVYPEVLIDADNGKTASWGSQNWWIHASYQACEGRGRFNHYGSCAPSQPGWEANTFPLSATGVVEMRIPFETIGFHAGEGALLGLAFNLTDTKEHGHLWPDRALISVPSSWGFARSSDGWMGDAGRVIVDGSADEDILSGDGDEIPPRRST